MKYKKRPVVVDAVQVTNKLIHGMGDMPDWMTDGLEDGYIRAESLNERSYLTIANSLFAPRYVAPTGSYITMDDSGFFKIHTEAEFNANYEPA